MGSRSAEARATLDLWRAQREGAAGLARRQQHRLASLVEHARAASPYYRHRYRGLPAGHAALADLPPVTKPELMAAFDDWVTDPAVTRADVEAFVADPARVGTPYRDGMFVCTSSGTTGHPGLFVHDAAALAVYRALVVVRIDLAWLDAGDWLRIARRGLRWAGVVGTGGHFAGAGWMELDRHRGSWRARRYRVFSVQRPRDELVAGLGAFDPTILSGYPSALALLAEEQEAGRLHLRPLLTELAGESSSDEMRDRISGAFGKVRDAYCASELPFFGFSCPHGWLHVCSDWAVLEPVDADLRPTPPGEPSHTVLLTNLANHVQPVIRYDLGDSVLARPDPCPCGSPLPAVRVTGRRDDVLHLAAGDRTVPVLPLAIGTVVDETPGVHRSQLLQTGPATLRVRLETGPGADPERVWCDVRAALDRYLAEQGAPAVELVRAEEPPARSETSGKFRQVIAVLPRET